MKTVRDISARSPKNKYMAHVYFDKYIKGVGSGDMIGDMDIEGLKHIVISWCGDNIKYAKGAKVVISENKKEYPNFEWQKVEEYRIRYSQGEFSYIPITDNKTE